MIRAAFFGSSVIAGKDLPDLETRFSTVASRILGWREVNLGYAESRLAGRDLDGRIVSAASGIARAGEAQQVNADLVIVHFGEEDFAGSVLVGERRIGMGVDSTASIPAVTQERRGGRRSVSRRLHRIPRLRDGVDGGSPLTSSSSASLDEPPPLIIRSLTGGAQALPGTFAGDFDALLAMLETTFKPGQIFVMTPPYRPDGDIPNEVGLRLSDYCDAIRRISRQHEVVVLDAFRDSTIAPSTYANLSDNGRDLNANGHQHLAAFVVEKMLSSMG